MAKFKASVGDVRVHLKNLFILHLCRCLSLQVRCEASPCDCLTSATSPVPIPIHPSFSCSLSRKMSDHPLKEMSDSNRSPLLPESLSSRFRLYESEPSSPTWPSSPQETHPALPLLEMPEEKVSLTPSPRLRWFLSSQTESKGVKDDFNSGIFPYGF